MRGGFELFFLGIFLLNEKGLTVLWPFWDDIRNLRFFSTHNFLDIPKLFSVQADIEKGRRL